MNFDQAWIPLALTLKVALWATLINLFLAIALAYLFAKSNFFAKELLDAMVTLPMVMPPTVLGYYLLVLIGKNGPIGAWLAHWNINLIFTWQGAVIAAAVVSFPLIFKAARASFESVEAYYEQAGRVLGVSNLAVFFRVALPLAWRGILSGVLLAFARSAGEFGATLMVAGSIPGKTQTLSIAVYEAVQAGQDQLANFLVLLTSFLCVLVLLLAGKFAPGRVANKV